MISDESEVYEGTGSATGALASTNGRNSTRSMIQAELYKREHNDAPVLQHYLHIVDDADSLQGYVNDCRARILADETIQRSIECLREIDSTADAPNTSADDTYQSRESDMYPHLLRILNWISQDAGAEREFVDSHKDFAVFEDHFPGYSTLQPDLVLQTRRPYDYDQRNSLLWRGVLSFIEVKLKGKDGPIKAARTGQLPQVKPIVAQAGDYARLHMALRPFQLFSICILIYGRHFTVSVYDRGGVLHSEEMAVYDMHGVTREFIAVVRRLSRDLSEYDLGRDHTARSLVPANAEASRNGYPTFLVRLNQSDRPGNVEPFSAIWQTEGKPIWTSYSLLGRGTVVWQAREYGGSQAAINSSPAPSEYIIKSAWRHISRSTESEIYRLLKARGVLGARGIATFHDGQDVIWKAPNDPSSLSKKLSVNALRPAANRLDANSDIVLHRVILSSVGKPLWDYDSREYFVRGLLDIVFGIKNLQDSKIVHRDISAGNVLLSTDPTYGFAGFITDFEFAKDLQDDVDLVELVFTEDSKGHKTFVGEQPAKSLDKGAGPEMTGTAQFMAVDKLQQLANQVRGVFRDLTCHDLESLFWVILYALYRKALRDAPTSEKRKTVLDVFSDYFGHIKIKDIYSSRLRLLKDLGHPDRQAPEMAFPGLVDYIDVNILKFMREYAFSVQDQISSNEVQSDPAFETVTRRSQRKRVSIPITWEMVRNLLLVLAKISTPPIVVDSTL